MKITIKKGDITKLNIDAIVNAANALGIMGGGVAGAIRRAGGEVIDQEAQAKSPIPIGKAVATTAGSLPCRFVIHAPAMEQPGGTATEASVKQATLGALECAVGNGVRTLAIPGIGTGIGGLSCPEAARAIAGALKEHDTAFLDEIILIDVNPEMVAAFQKELS